MLHHEGRDQQHEVRRAPDPRRHRPQQELQDQERAEYHREDVLEVAVILDELAPEADLDAHAAEAHDPENAVCQKESDDHPQRQRQWLTAAVSLRLLSILDSRVQGGLRH